jgi:hypothetical protein
VPDRSPLDFQETILSLKIAIAKPFFMEIIMLITWKVWTVRNDFIFKVVPPRIYKCRKRFNDEIALLVNTYHGLFSWVDYFR